MSSEEEGWFEWRKAPSGLLSRRPGNFVREMIHHPCARPWYIYATTFAPAFLELLITVALLDLGDLIRMSAVARVRDRPSGRGKAGKHFRRFKAEGKATSAQRFSQKGLQTLLMATAPLEAIGFTWLLINAGDRFFYNWQTLLDKSDFCTAGIFTGPMQRSRGVGFVGILPGGAVTPLPTFEQDRAGWGSGPLSVALPAGFYLVIWAVTFVSPASGINGWTAQIRTNSILGQKIFNSPPVDGLPLQETEAIAVAKVLFPTVGGGSVAWELQGPAVPAGVNTVKARVIVQRVG